MSIQAFETEIEAVRVKIVGDDRPVPEVKKENLYTILKTFLSAFPSVAPFPTPENILPASDKRIYASVTVLGVMPTNCNIYLCGSLSDAQPASGSPVGVQIQPGMTYPVIGTSDVWLVAFGTGAAPFVSVQSVYKR